VLRLCEADAARWVGDPVTSEWSAEAARARLEAWGEPAHLAAVRISAVALGAAVDQIWAELRPCAEDAAGTRSARAAATRAREHLARAEHAFAAGRPRGSRPGVEAQAWLARARAEGSRVEHSDGDPQAWAAAVDAFAVEPYEQACCQLGQARALVANGRSGEAAEAARAAHDVAARLGARPLREAIEALGRAARLDLGFGVPGGGGPLTPREQQVLALVADGLTNRAIGSRLFISEKTASVHVSNILAKLGASGRTEAVTIAHRRGLLAQPQASQP
jgi:DNA-binding NarL/FixJ family response regulator